MGTEPSGHGMPSTTLMPSMAMAPAPSCVNGLIGSNVTHFESAIAVDFASAAAVSCKRALTHVNVISYFPTTYLKFESLRCAIAINSDRI